MTISLKVSVNGDYVATVKHQIDGADAQEKVVIGDPKAGPVEQAIDFRHGSVNTYEITKEHGSVYRERLELEEANKDQEENHAGGEDDDE